MVVRAIVLAFLLAACERSAPVAAPAPAPAAGTLQLVVAMAAQGITVHGADRFFAPACATRSTRPIVTVPLASGTQDYAGLTRCLAQIKTDFPNERAVTLRVDADLPYEQMIHAMEAMRFDGARELFPDITIGTEE